MYWVLSFILYVDSLISSSQQPFDVQTMIVSISQIRKLRLR